jgi:hypothetical protein
MSMNRVCSLMPGFLVALLALTTLPALAQEGESEAFDFSTLDGIEAGVSRSWVVDFAALLDGATPDAGVDPFATVEGTYFLVGWVLEFDDDDAARNAFDMFREAGADIFTADFDQSTLDISERELGGLGDEGYAFDFASTAEGDKGHFRYAFVRSGALLFVGIGIALSEGGLDTVDTLLEAMVDDGEKGDVDVSFDDFGGSTGGLWGFFPEDDDDLLGELIPAGDQILYPRPDDDNA